MMRVMRRTATVLALGALFYGAATAAGATEPWFILIPALVLAALGATRKTGSSSCGSW